MAQVLARDLVKGRRYRIENVLMPPRISSFVQNFDTSLGIQSQFNNIIRYDKRREHPLTCATYMDSEWQFYESAYSLVLEQAMRGLCNRIPEDTAGLIERFLMPKTKGAPDRYAERSTVKSLI